jgi:uncharacterized membrane protein
MIKYLALFILLFGCQDYNSNSGDKFRYGPLGLADGSSTEFTRAYVIIQIRCSSCHPAWAAYKNEQDWVDNGKVVGGNPDQSSVVNRIKNFGATTSNMPTDSGPLPEEEYEAIRTWVLSVPP